MTITDELIHILKRQQMRGVKTAQLSETTRSLLFDPRARNMLPDTDRRQQPDVQPEQPRRQTEQPRRQPEQPHTQRQPTRTANAADAPAPQAVASSPPDTTEADAVKDLDWEPLRQCVAACQRCPLHAGRTQTVFDDGNRNARLMFIGEGPGREEDEQGVPFVGPAGKLLTRMIAAMQFERSEVYIANIVKCRPPRNRNPEDTEAEACLPYLRRQIALVKPEVIVLLGAVPLRHLLGESGINRLHGRWYEFEGIPVMPTFHPAYLLRVDQRKRDAWEDLKKVMERLGKDPEQTKRRNTENS